MIQLFENEYLKPFKSWTFPGKEVGVKIDGINKNAHYAIFCELPSSDDIFTILNMADALARADVPKDQVSLFLPYLPYGRQDRVCSPGESFALEVFVKVLSTAHIGFVVTDDLHSKVSSDLLSRHVPGFFENLQHECAQKLPIFDYLVAPDAGASQKILQHDQVVHGDAEVVILSKTRKDGQVIYEDLPVGTLKGRVCVVDDLADGAATFVSLGKMLKGTQPEITELCLYVTHGIFSKGVDVLKDVYAEIYVHNMYNEADLEKVNVI